MSFQRDGQPLDPNPVPLHAPIADKLAEYDSATFSYESSHVNTSFGNRKPLPQLPRHADVAFAGRLRICLWFFGTSSVCALACVLIWYFAFFDAYRKSDALHVDDELKARKILFSKGMYVGEPVVSAAADSVLHLFSISNDMVVSGPSQFLSAVHFQNVTTVDRMTAIDIVSPSDTAGQSLECLNATVTRGLLSVNGSLTCVQDCRIEADLFAGFLQVRNSSVFSGRLHIENTYSADSLSHFGAVQFLDDVTVNGTLRVDGFTTCDRGVTIGANVDFGGSWTNVSGPASFMDTVTSTGSFNLPSRMIVTSSPPSLSLLVPLFVTANSSVSGSGLQVGRSVVYNGLTEFLSYINVSSSAFLYSTSRMSSPAFVDGNALFLGANRIYGSMIHDGPVICSSSGNLTILSVSQFSSNVVVLNTFLANGPAVLSGSTVMNRTFLAYAPVSIYAPLSVENSVTLAGNASTSDVHTTGSWRIYGSADFSAPVMIYSVTNTSSLLVDTNVISLGNFEATASVRLAYAESRSAMSVGQLSRFYDNCTFHNNTQFTAALEVGGDLVIRSNVSFNGSLWNGDGSIAFSNQLFVSSAANFLQQVDVSGDVVVAGAVIMSSNMSFIGNLSVAGYGFVGRDVRVSENVSVTEDAEFDRDLSLGSALSVTGRSTVSGNVNFLSTMLVDGTTSVTNATFCGSVAGLMNALFTSSSRVVLQSNFSVHLRSTFNSGVQFLGPDVNFWTSAFADAMVTVARTFNVSGNAVLSSNTQMHSVTSTSGVTVGKDVTVRGNASIATLLRTNYASFGSNLDVSTTAVFELPVEILGGSVSARQQFSSSGTFMVYSPAYLSGPTTFSGTVSFMDTVETSSTVAFDQQLVISGSSSLTCFNSTFVQASRPFRVRGDLTVNGPAKLSATLSLSLDVTVTGGATLWNMGPTIVQSPVEFTAMVNVSGPASVSGATSFAGPVTVQSSGSVRFDGPAVASLYGTAVLAGPVTLKNTAKVLGSSTFKGQVTVQNGFDLASDVTFSGPVQIAEFGSISFAQDVYFLGNTGPEFSATHLSDPGASLGRFDPRQAVSATNPSQVAYSCLNFKTTDATVGLWFPSGSGCFLAVRRADLV